MDQEQFQRKSTKSQPVKIEKYFSCKSQRNFTNPRSSKQGSLSRNEIMNEIDTDEEIMRIEYLIKYDEQQLEEIDSNLQEWNKKIERQKLQNEQLQNYVNEKQAELDQLQKRLLKNQQEPNNLKKQSHSLETQILKDKHKKQVRNIELEIKKLKYHLLIKKKQLKAADEQVRATQQFTETKNSRRSYVIYQLQQLKSHLRKLCQKKNVPKYKNSKFIVV